MPVTLCEEFAWERADRAGAQMLDALRRADATVRSRTDTAAAGSPKAR